MRSPWIVFWKHCPDDPTTCGWDQVMRVGPTGPAFPLILLPSSSRLGPYLDQDGRLHEVMATNALVKANPFITEHNLGVGAKTEGSTGMPKDLGAV